MAGPFQNVHVCDPNNPDRILAVNPDGSINTSGGSGPGGGLTDAELRASPVPMTGAFVKVEDTPSADGDSGLVVFAVRHDSDTPTAGTDGDYTALKCDEAGRLKVAAQPGSYALVTGSITAAAQTVFIDCSRGSNIMAHMVATSLVGHNVTFEGSIDSTNGTDGAWFAIQAVRTNANTIETATGTLAATPAYGWELSVNGLKYMRVRATAHTSGTALWKFQQAPYATEPIPAAQVSGTQPVSGSVSATLVAASVVAGAFQRAISATTNGIITFHHLISAATTNATSVKASAGTIANIELTNTSASMKFFKLYNKASAPTVGTDTPILTLGIPANGSRSFVPPVEWRLATGIAYAITGAVPVSDTTAVALNDVAVSIGYL